MNKTESTTEEAVSPRGTLLLDPTSEVEPSGRSLVARRASLEGLTVGLLDISKPRGNVFLDRLEEHLGRRGAAVQR